MTAKHLNLGIRDQNIKLTNQINYLYVILQQDLHWKKYLSNFQKVTVLAYYQRLDIVYMYIFYAYSGIRTKTANIFKNF